MFEVGIVLEMKYSWEMHRVIAEYFSLNPSLQLGNLKNLKRYF
jgi:hypothetical protein